MYKYYYLQKNAHGEVEPQMWLGASLKVKINIILENLLKFMGSFAEAMLKL